MISNHLKLLYLIGLIAISTHISVFCQSPWIKKIDIGHYDNLSGLIHGDTTAFYVTHRNEEGGGNDVTQNLTKYSIDGNEIWNVKFENSPHNVYEGPAGALGNGDLLVCFLFEDSSNLDYQIYMITAEGDIQWTITLPRITPLEIDYAFELYKVIQFSANDLHSNAFVPIECALKGLLGFPLIISFK